MTSAVLTAPADGTAGVDAGARGVRRWWRPVLLTVGGVLAVVELHGRLPGAAATWTALRQTGPGWLLAAAVLQVLSMTAFAEQQRYLLRAFGVRMPARVSLAVSYARSAISTALPGGSAVSAGYAFRQFRARGADQPVAAAVMLLSGVASVAGLALLYAGDLLAWARLSGRPVAVLVAVVAAAVAVLVRRARGTTVVPAVVGTPTPAAGTVAQRIRAALRETATLGRAVPAHEWLRVVALAALNWLTDLACLLASVHAVGLTVPVRTVATGYLVAQLVRQVPVTPGGIGVIEASLVVALTAAGAAQGPAAAAVLIYRLLSCWSIVPIGLACWVAQRPPAEPATAATTTATG